MINSSNIYRYSFILGCLALSGIFLGDIKTSPTIYRAILDMIVSINLFLLALSYFEE